MEATDILRKEHRAIENVLDSLDRASDALRHGRDVPSDIFADGLDFIKNFADRCHHAKEEGRLFPMYGQKGLPTQGGPVQVMLYEHEEGRSFIRTASQNYEKWSATGDTASGIAMVDALQNYINLLREHIQKEDNILYPMGDMRLTHEDDQLLVKQFDDIEEHELGPGVHEKYHEMIERLEEETARF